MSKILTEIYNNKELKELYDNFVFTPMMQEWKTMKENLVKKYGKNTILFFQVGTFYETYFHDAYITSRLLGFTLTKKDKKKKDSVVMAGMPLVANMDKLSKLLEQNFNIAFVSEFPDPQDPKRIIRKLNKVITPSTNLEFLDQNNNYLLSIYEGYSNIGFTLIDISTGDLKYLNVEKSKLEDYINILYKYNISEVIIDKEPSQTIKNILNSLGIVYYNIFDKKINHTGIIEFQFGNLIEELELYYAEESIIATANAIEYIRNITNSNLSYINEIKNLLDEKRLFLDKQTIKNLEIIENYSGKRKTSLFGIINNTITPFGSRTLRQNILSPFSNEDDIIKRLNSVEYLVDNKTINDSIRNILSEFYDIEKLSAKLGNNSINPIDIINLSNSLKNINKLKGLIIDEKNLSILIQKLNNYIEMNNLIEFSLLENPNINIREGNIFKEGYNEELDNQRDIFYNIEGKLKEKEIELKKATGINTLKIIQNKQGFFIEVKNQDEGNVPESFTYLKKLNNSIRYTNTEIQELDKKYKLSEIKIKELEYNLFQGLRIELSKYINIIFSDAKILSEIDILSTFSYNALIYNYKRPLVNHNNKLKIINGRHPIVEFISAGDFISNDTIINKKTLKLITGPNMGGKSTYLKQNALIYILFQIGSFIPADKNSELSIIKGIYTRIGASDSIEDGLSTFAQEIIEMKDIIKKLDDNTLVLIDEIGRGTDIENGLALAEAFLEYFSKQNKGFIFFSTHYSNLVNLEKEYSNIETLKAKAEIEDGEIVFYHKIIPGIEKNSFGIEIAELYKLPDEIIKRAKEIREKIK